MRPVAVRSPGLVFQSSLNLSPVLTLQRDRYMSGTFYQMPHNVEQATQALRDEGIYRFGSFSADDAVALGLSLRKRFRVSSRHAHGKGLVISIQSIVGHTLFACTVGDLGNTSGLAEVGMDSWGCLEGMMNVVRRTGHSSYYVEKGMGAMGKTSKRMGAQSEFRINGGGEWSPVPAVPT
jgi:uncharacterized protein (UPF0303 family)